jgi:hypothetical protein
MNKIYAIAAVLALFGTSVLADSTYALQVVSGDIDAAVIATVDGVRSVSVGLRGLEHEVGPVSAALRGQLQYSLTDESIAARGEYRAYYSGIYSTSALEYIVDESTLKGGDWTVEQTIGTGYSLTDIVFAYAEVQHTWSLGDEVTSAGGIVELGVDLDVAQMITVNPYVYRGYDGADEDWSAGVSATYSF